MENEYEEDDLESSDPEWVADFEKFDEDRSIFIKFLRKHSVCTRAEFIEGLAWPPGKVDIFLELNTKVGVAVLVETASGEPAYRYEDFRNVLQRRLQERWNAPSAQGKGAKDWIQLLKDGHYL